MNTTTVKPVAPYVGGKHLLARSIIESIMAIPHTCYAEPFIGMGGVFLRRPERAKSEVINDYNREVANFLSLLQRHYIPFMEMMRFQITTRTEFERLTRTRPDTLTDLERAARFLILTAYRHPAGSAAPARPAPAAYRTSLYIQHPCAPARAIYRTSLYITSRLPVPTRPASTSPSSLQCSTNPSG